MNKTYLPTWILLFTLLAIPHRAFSQKIENVLFEVSGSTILIYYDLLEITNDQAVIIRVFLSTDGGSSYGDPLKSVTGDAGVVIGPGVSKKIVWDVFAEVDELVSEAVKFRVQADLLLSNQERSPFNPGYLAAFNANLGSKIDLSAYGFNLKAGLCLKQFTLGLRGDYFHTYGEQPDLADFGYYTGFSGGLFVEYDFLRNPRYSLYPYAAIGQTKISYKSEPSTGTYAGYTIYYLPGVGFDIRLMEFLFLGIELEYLMAPVVDIDDQTGNELYERITLDGFNVGVTLKFVRQAAK